MSGLVLNGERPFDMAAERDPRVEIEGDVHLLMRLPRDLNIRNNDLNPWQRVRYWPEFSLHSLLLPSLHDFYNSMYTRQCPHVVLFSPPSRHPHSLAHHLARGMTWCSVVPGLDVTWMMRMSAFPFLIPAQVRARVWRTVVCL